MCGRYTIRRIEALRQAVDAILSPAFEEFSEHGPRYNVAPSQNVPLVRLNKNGERVLDAVRWGLIPSWTKGKPKTQPINARSETVATSGMFRQAYDRRRCLMPADGFYEWQGATPPKQPYFIHRPDDAPFMFAAIWERWKVDDEAETIDTCCQLTTTPNGVIAPIHNRMPVILHARDYARWLDRDMSGADVADLLRPLPNDELEAWEVSTAVNSVKHNGPHLVVPAS